MRSIIDIFKRIGRKLKRIKEELEEQSVAVVKADHIDCCASPKKFTRSF